MPGLSLAESDEIPPVPGSSVTEEAWDSDTASEPEIGSPETPATTPEETMGTDGAPAALSTESEIPDTPMMNVTSISGIPRDGLLVEYLFEGNAQDSSGMGHHPSLVELDTYDPSRFGQSLEIGAGGKVQIASDTDLNLAMIREVTIAFWFRETPSTHSSTSAQVPLFGYITSNYWPNYIDRNIYLR